MATNSYLTISAAATYFAERLATAPWDEATQTDQLKALKQATRSIDNLNYSGQKSSSAQLNEFPRGGDTAVPQDVLNAVCEEALALLDGVDIAMEKANLTATSQGLGDARGTYDRDIAVMHLASGIASPTAWDLLRKFLRDPSEITMRRVS